MNELNDIIQQQQNRITELELAFNELGKSAFNVVKYFGGKTMELKEYKTCELVEELKKREGVKTIEVEPYDEYLIETTIEETDNIEEEGPAIILVVTD